MMDPAAAFDEVAEALLPLALPPLLPLPPLPPLPPLDPVPAAVGIFVTEPVPAVPA